jgi:hypothetical protein
LPAKLPALHDGHASLILQNAFHDALEIIEEVPRTHNGVVRIDSDTFNVDEIIALMLGCTDLLPMRTRDLLRALAAGMAESPPVADVVSYSDCARIVQHYREIMLARS